MANLIFLLTGVLLWTFLEYVIHRFLGHQKRGKNIIRKEHLRHHAESGYFAPMHKKLLLAIIVFASLAIITGWIFNWYIGLLFSSGFAGMYFIYEVTHRRFHIKEPIIRYGLKMRKHHFYHHFSNPKYNHGVTTAFWDRVFGTYQPVNIIPVPGKMAMVWLLDEKKIIKKRYSRHFKIS